MNVHTGPIYSNLQGMHIYLDKLSKTIKATNNFTAILNNVKSVLKYAWCIPKILLLYTSIVLYIFSFYQPSLLILGMSFSTCLSRWYFLESMSIQSICDQHPIQRFIPVTKLRFVFVNIFPLTKTFILLVWCTCGVM